MAYFPSTTGQGQGFAQIVKQNEQAIGDIENQYLKQERERQEAEAKRNSLMRKMGYLGNNLDGAYKAAFKQRYDDILSQVKAGEIDPKDGVDILEMDAKDLKSSQDQFINYAKQDHSKDISWDKDLVSNPDVYLGDMAFGQEVYEDPFKTIQAINSGMARTERRPDTLSEQFRKKVVPLLKQSENVFTQEELDTKSDDELMTILRTTNRQVPQEILNQIEQGFVNDPEVQREVIIGNGMYKVTPDGVSIEDEANVDAFASDFFKRMTSPRVQVIEQERQVKPEKTDKSKITEQDLLLAKDVKEKVNNFQDTRQLGAINDFLAPYNLSVSVTDDIIQFVTPDGSSIKSGQIKIDDAKSIYRFLSKNVPDIKLDAVNQVEFEDPTPEPVAKNKEDIEFLLKAYENNKTEEAKELAKTFGEDVEYVAADEIKIGDKTFDPRKEGDVEQIFNLLQNRNRKTKDTTTRQDLNERERRGTGESGITWE